MKDNIENDKIINQNLMTGLFSSVKNNNIKAFSLLFNSGANINLLMSETPEVLKEKSLLQRVIFFHSKEVFELLISKKANIIEEDNIYHILQTLIFIIKLSI